MTEEKEITEEEFIQAGLDNVQEMMLRANDWEVDAQERILLATLSTVTMLRLVWGELANINLFIDGVMEVGTMGAEEIAKLFERGGDVD